MIGRRVGAIALAVLMACTCGCDHLVDGAATWPGARLERSILTDTDFPTGVHYALFENVGNAAVIVAAFPTPNPTIAVKATLPQTFLDAAARQADRLGAS